MRNILHNEAGISTPSWRRRSGTSPRTDTATASIASRSMITTGTLNTLFTVRFAESSLRFIVEIRPSKCLTGAMLFWDKRILPESVLGNGSVRTMTLRILLYTGRELFNAAIDFLTESSETTAYISAMIPLLLMM